MKILVTGGAGFIGGNFVHHMVNKYPDYEIVNLDLLTYAGNLETLKPVESASLGNDMVRSCLSILRSSLEVQMFCGKLIQISLHLLWNCCMGLMCAVVLSL